MAAGNVARAIVRGALAALVFAPEARALLDADRPAGLNNVPFRADGLRSGLYFYELRAPGVLRTRKMLIVR